MRTLHFIVVVIVLRISEILRKNYFVHFRSLRDSLRVFCITHTCI